MSAAPAPAGMIGFVAKRSSGAGDRHDRDVAAEAIVGVGTEHKMKAHVRIGVAHAAAWTRERGVPGLRLGRRACVARGTIRRER
jgi:hypothetical protein